MRTKDNYFKACMLAAALTTLGLVNNSLAATSSQIKASQTSNPSTVKQNTFDGKIQNASLKAMPIVGKRFAGCSVGTVWGGNIGKECKKNNKVRLAKKFCRANGYQDWLDAPKSATEDNRGNDAVTWRVNQGQSWEQGRFITSSRSDRVWKKITCKKTTPGTTTLSKLSMANTSLKLDVCAVDGGAIWNRCSSDKKKKIATAVCRAKGFNGYKKINGKPFLEGLTVNATHYGYNTSSKKWSKAGGATAFIAKLDCI